MVLRSPGKAKARVAGVVSGIAAAAFAGLAASMAPAAAETGVMSHYSALGVTASGRSYKASDYVAAHKTLPLGTIVRVENLRNGRSATVRIVDRGPYIAGRIIDVTPGVADDLGFRGQGLAPTRVTVLGRGGSTGPYDRGGKASGNSYAEESSEKASSKASTKPVRVASASSGAYKRSASYSPDGDSSVRVLAMRNGS